MDIEGTIQFIISQQAEFAADITALKTGLEHLRETVSQLTGVVSELAISQQNTNAILENLAERAVEASERQDRCDERLHTLIAAVERHVSSHP